MKKYLIIVMLQLIYTQPYQTTEYPWIGFPEANLDHKDNNPWNHIHEFLIYDTTYDGRVVRIGNGEPNDTGDPDGDGVMGEDWFNCYDDDGDGLIDEDYFEADGIDNDGDCLGDTNNDGCICCPGDSGVDEYIDQPYDLWFDGVDNDQNGNIDDNAERYTGSQTLPNWASYLENYNIIIINGRQNEYIGGEDFEDTGPDGLLPGDAGYIESDEGQWNGQWNPGEFFIDSNGDGTWTQGIYNYWYFNTDNPDNLHLRGEMNYVYSLDSLIFDVFIYDFGDDGIAGDNAWIDDFGDGLFNPWEGGNTLIAGTNTISIPSEPCIAGLFGASECNENSLFFPNLHDCGLDGICPNDADYPGFADYGEGNGVWDSFDWDGDEEHDEGDLWDSESWIDSNNNAVPDIDEVNWEDTFPYLNGQYDPGEIIRDCGQDGLCAGDTEYIGPDPGEGDGLILLIDSNELDGIFDTGDGCFGCEEEPFIDVDANGYYTLGEPFSDTNTDGIWTPKDYTPTWSNCKSLIGDINNNSVTDIVDIIALINFIMDDIYILEADIDLNGSVDVADIIIIINIILNI